MTGEGAERLAVLRQWVEAAEEDLRTVEILMKDEEPPAYSVCFHAQQCAEKYLKALLVAKGIPFRKVHDIEALMALVPSGERPEVAAEVQEQLSLSAVVGRYPGRAVLTREHVLAAVAAARDVRAAIRALLPPEATAP